MATSNSNTGYTERPCDNGTVDVCQDGQVVFQNLPAPVARMVVQHDELVAALRRVRDDHFVASGEMSLREACALIDAVLAKVQP